jgi:phosphate transport system permease protein
LASQPISLRPTADLRRRRLVNRAMEAVATAAAVVAVALLLLVVISVGRRGWSALSIDFFTEEPPLFGRSGGGIAPAIVGTAIIVGLATVIALPVGVLVALFLTEVADRRSARLVRLALDLLNGLPSIVIGVFIFGLLVVGHQQSGYAASVALAIIMLPLVARASQEALQLVPRHQREAAAALGVSRWRATLGIVLPAALGGILTGTILAVARAAGETAPLLFTSSIFANQVGTDPTHALANILVTIFTLSESPSPDDHARGWAAALVLMGFVLVTSLVGRALLARGRRRSRARVRRSVRCPTCRSRAGPSRPPSRWPEPAPRRSPAATRSSRPGTSASATGGCGRSTRSR